MSSRCRRLSWMLGITIAAKINVATPTGRLTKKIQRQPRSVTSRPPRVGPVTVAATVTGPTLGGLLVTDLGWRWIFFVNLPVGVATLIFAAIVMPNIQLNRRHRLDIPGTLLATVGLFLVTYALIEGQPHHWGKVWGPITIVELITAGLVVLGVFVF